MHRGRRPGIVVYYEGSNSRNEALDNVTGGEGKASDLKRRRERIEEQ